MLDLVPLARPRWEVADGDLQPRLVGQPLQFECPQAHARPIAPTAIRGDQQNPGLRIRGLPHRIPPAAQTLHGEHRRVVIRPHVDPARIPGPLAIQKHPGGGVWGRQWEQEARRYVSSMV